MINFSDITGFEWDEGNKDKNAIKHKVAWFECEEVFFNEPLMYNLDLKYSIKEKRFHILGQTNSGRSLFISFTIRKDKIRVISARDMNRKELIKYEKVKKNSKIQK